MLAQERDHTLRLAERIGADEMGALRKQRQRVEQFGDLQTRVAVAKNRQRKRSFGNEKVARHELEWRAGRIGHVLVVAGSHHPQAISLDQRLRRAKHVTGRMQRHFHLAHAHTFTVARSLHRPCEIVAVSQTHQVERFLRRQDRAMARPRVVGMRVRDQRPLYRPCRIDMEGTELTECTDRRRHEDIVGTHRQ